MIRTLTISFFILILGINLTYRNMQINSKQQSKYLPDTILCWSKQRKLTWNDFRGSLPKSCLTSYGTEAIAVTAAEIKYEIKKKDDLIEFKVYPIFIKTLSWKKDSSEATLIHEQLHFDIAEVVARKIRKEFNLLDIQNVNDIQSYVVVAKRLLSERNKMDDQYDQETLNGAIDFMQKKWNIKILSELCELKEYEVDYSEYLKE